MRQIALRVRRYATAVKLTLEWHRAYYEGTPTGKESDSYAAMLMQKKLHGELLALGVISWGCVPRTEGWPSEVHAALEGVRKGLSWHPSDFVNRETKQFDYGRADAGASEIERCANILIQAVREAPDELGTEAPAAAPPRGSSPPPEPTARVKLTKRQAEILAAVTELARSGSGPWLGKEIAAQAQLRHGESKTREDFSTLRKLGFLKSYAPGYDRTDKPYP
jgi:hypothetical protein